MGHPQTNEEAPDYPSLPLQPLLGAGWLVANPLIGSQERGWSNRKSPRLCSFPPHQTGCWKVSQRECPENGDTYTHTHSEAQLCLH